MSDTAKPVIQPTGLVHGHSECRYLDETIPVLTRYWRWISSTGKTVKPH